MPKAIVSLSGGLDSTTLLHKVVENAGAENVVAVTFSYPSKHNKLESLAAWGIANHYGICSYQIDASRIFSFVKSDLLVSGRELPKGHYEEESMRQTVVPFRNGIFLSILTAIAESEGKGSTVYAGVHQGDHYIYPDCRLEFIQSFASAIWFGTDRKVELKTPFANSLKVDILRWGIAKQIPYHLTRTCYSDQEIACGVCGSCQERLEAFSLLKMEDPISYVSRTLLPKKES